MLISAIAYTGAFKKSEASHGAGTVREYERKIFDANNPIAIDIIMDADKWSGMLEDANAEEENSSGADWRAVERLTTNA